MDITQLRYFMATANHLNYTKASEELFISRQALRQSIQGLEQDLGSPLFQNRSNRLSLTPTGLALQEKASGVIAAFDQMEAEIRTLTHPFQELSICYSGSIRTFLFPDIDTLMDEFRTQNPSIPLRVDIGSNDDIWEALRNGTCRFGLMMAMPWHTPEFTFLPLQQFTLGIKTTSLHALNQKDKLLLSDLNGLTLLGMGNLETTFQPLAKDLQKQKISFHYETVPDPIDAFYHSKHGDAYVFNVAEAQKDHYPNLRILPLEGYQWPLCLIYANQRPLANEEDFFLKFLKNHLEKHPISF